MLVTAGKFVGQTRLHYNWKEINSMTAQNTKPLLGCFEICLFMAQGLKRFSREASSARWSFLLPLLTLPLIVASAIMLSSGYSAVLLAGLHGLRLVLGFALFLAVVYLFCRHYERTDRFNRFICAYNWFHIPMFVLTVPMLFLMGFGFATTGEIASYALFIALLGYIYTGFIICHSLKIPWEMAAFIAIVCMAINQTMLDLLVFVRDTIAVI